jgi:hypothetical protein
MRVEVSVIFNPKRGEFVAAHGHSANGKRSGTYVSWQGMQARCFNGNTPGYANYGGRGITVCDRWRNFPEFLADMGERPAGTAIERIDNDGNYEPGNCRWAPREEQQQNTRRTRLDRTLVDMIRASPKSIATLASELDVSRTTVRNARNGVSW